MNKSCIITGFTGASGPYLSKILLDNGYSVHAIVRENSQRDMKFIKEHGLQDVNIINGDITDKSSITKIIADIQPDEFYNLAAITNPGISFKQPELTLEVNGLSVLHILDAIRLFSPTTKLCQISTSEIFSGDSSYIKNEKTPICPISPYGASKAYAGLLVDIYRKSYGIWANNLICFNHESPRRNNNAVTQKIIHAVKNKSECKLGNLNICRDWGDAQSFVYGMFLSTRETEPDDYVLGTGKCYSLRDFCKIAYSYIDIDLEFTGDGANEVGIDSRSGKIYISIDSSFYRPNDHAGKSVADTNKIKTKLNWSNKLRLDQTILWMLNNVYPTN